MFSVNSTLYLGHGFWRATSNKTHHVKRNKKWRQKCIRTTLFIKYSSLKMLIFLERQTDFADFQLNIQFYNAELFLAAEVSLFLG